MGSHMSTLYDTKAYFERKLMDHKRHLTRVLSKSNSMESLDKAEIGEIKANIRKSQIMLSIVDQAIEVEHAPSF
jgi:hypothetical protein